MGIGHLLVELLARERDSDVWVGLLVVFGQMSEGKR